MAKLNKTVIAALKLINTTGRVTQEVGKPLIDMGLIEVNTQDIDGNGAAAARLTDKGNEGIGIKTSVNPVVASNFALIDNADLPESKRGGFGRTTGVSKYPFATMNIGQSFFVSNAEVDDGNALKKLTSTVSNMNNKYRTDTGATEVKERTKRGEDRKAVFDADGNKVKETVTVPIYRQDRKFSIRAVKAGNQYGGWIAPADGALIKRIAVE